MTNKTLLFSVISFFAFTHAEESTTFVPRVCTVAFKIHPKNPSELTEFDNLSQNILDTVQKNNKGLLYQTFLGLLHDMQLAVFSNQSTLQIATEVMESLIDSQLLQDALAQEAQPEATSQSTEALAENAESVSQEVQSADQTSPIESSEKTVSEETSNEEISDENNSQAQEELAAQEDNSQDVNEQSNDQNEEELAAQEEYVPAFILSISIVASKEEELALFQEAKEVLSNLAQGSVEISQEVENFINQKGRGMLRFTPENDQEQA